MEGPIAEPTWWGFIRVWSSKGRDLGAARVLIPARYPFVTHGYSVRDECPFVAPPHFSGGVILPTRSRIRQGVEKLKNFDALFTETLSVEGFCACGVIGVGEECLH
jgi:hypothetical protein